MMKINISGLMKLRLAITALFVMMTSILILSLWLGASEIQNEENFVESLTPSEYDELADIVGNRPVVSYAIPYAAIGLIMYIVDFVLFVLMIKVWRTKAIY